MTISEIQTRIERLEKVNSDECGGRVSQFLSLLRELLKAKQDLEKAK